MNDVAGFCLIVAAFVTLAIVADAWMAWWGRGEQ